MNPQNKKQVILVILDGWGISQPGPGNAVTLAKTPNMDRLWASYPHTQINASGDAVGLPKGEVGNTETGHLNLGAGRIVYQDLERINMSIADGSFFQNQVIIDAVNHAKENNSNLHIMGLVGAGGVHSNIEHLFALLQFMKLQKFNKVFVHVFTDGRDSPPNVSIEYIKRLEEILRKENVGKIATVMGRYWAMDRDRRWDRTSKAYFALTKGLGQLVKTPEEAIKISYSEGKTDEFIDPSLICDDQGKPIGTITNNDSVIFFNFRIDRPRQLTSAFLVNEFLETGLSLDFDPFLEKYEKTHIPGKVKGYQKVFDRGEKLKNLYFVTMTEYSKSLVGEGAKVALPHETVDMPLGRVIAENDLRQLRLAESEKERFVTFYFNGQRETAFPGEDRIIVPSSDVSTYDQKPEMSAKEITEKLLEKLRNKEDYPFILVNYANPDMVGHTGNIGPAVIACEIVDECIGKIANFVLAYGGFLLITSDHGNCEEMLNLRSGQIDTEHSGNPVPFIAVSRDLLGKPQAILSGILADVSPTILSLLDIKVPSSMTGRNLLGNIVNNFQKR